MNTITRDVPYTGYNFSGIYHDFTDDILIAYGDANWDYFVTHPDNNPYVYAVAKSSCPGAETCHFGYLAHIVRLIQRGQINVRLTAYGRDLILRYYPNIDI